MNTERQSTNAFDRNLILYKEACHTFALTLDKMRKNQTSKKQGDWMEWREEHINIYGEDSIFNLIPERYNPGYGPITALLMCLTGLGINTKHELLLQRPEDLAHKKIGSRYNSIGKRGLQITKELQDISLAEFYLKWSR